MMLRAFSGWTLLLVACAIAGCDGDDEVVIDHSDEGAEGDSAEPLYAITGTTFGPEGNSSYVALVPSLARETAIDYGRVLALPGGTSLFGDDGGGFFAV